MKVNNTIPLNKEGDYGGMTATTATYRTFFILVSVSLGVCFFMDLPSPALPSSAYLNTTTAAHQGHLQTTTSPAAASALSFRELFQEAQKQTYSNRSTNTNQEQDSYEYCLENFTAFSGPVVTAYSTMAPQEQCQIAEEYWLNQQGKLWMQHSRKAGGTSLCMLLQLNSGGLIRTRAGQWDVPQRQTCQMQHFCSDCSLVNQPYFQGWDKLPRLMNCAMDRNERNFFEAEATVSPPDIVTNPEWANFVFVSTIRHPIARIRSSLQNDYQYLCGDNNPNEVSNCARERLQTVQIMEEECQKSIYFCYSNYYVRMFAGYSPLDEINEETLEKAKKNFLRYSCVILQEHWQETALCLGTKLGLYLNDEVEFNVAGDIHENRAREKGFMDRAPPSDEDFLNTFMPDELQRLKDANALDIVFYEWAKEQIFDGMFVREPEE